LAVHHHRSSSRFGLFDEATFQVTHMTFGQAFVLADKENDVVPGISIQVTP
jgi:hypothetical protein